MALDEALLETAGHKGVVSVRVYTWRAPCVTIGRFQSVRRTMPPGALRSCVPMARRITGGRAILHGGDVTLSVAMPTRGSGLALRDARDVQGIYAALVAPIARSLASQGAEVIRGKGGSAGDGGDCFDSAGACDLVELRTGLKRVGAALHVAPEAALLQASIPCRPCPCPDPELAAVFRGTEQLVGALESSHMDEDSLCRSLFEAFGELFGPCTVSAEPGFDELERAAELVRTRYARPEWTAEGRLAPLDAGLVAAPAGGA
jgi:lipoate-protein ligase A